MRPPSRRSRTGVKASRHELDRPCLPYDVGRLAPGLPVRVWPARVENRRAVPTQGKEPDLQKEPGMNIVKTVISADGTPIAVERTGSGQPVILIGGAFNDRSTVAGLAGVLAGEFTAVTYDRRGRGDSGDAASYAVEREIEDLAAVISYAGEPASVFGHSSGAILALEAASRGLAVSKVAVYEPTYVVEG